MNQPDGLLDGIRAKHVLAIRPQACKRWNATATGRCLPMARPTHPRLQHGAAGS